MAKVLVYFEFDLDLIFLPSRIRLFLNIFPLISLCSLHFRSFAGCISLSTTSSACTTTTTRQNKIHKSYTWRRIWPSMAFGAAMGTFQQLIAPTSSCGSYNNGSQMWGQGLKSGINVTIPAKSSKGVVRMGLKEDGPSVAVVGATGAVGLEFLSVLSDRDFPYRSLKLLASKRSAGKHLTFEGRDYLVEELTEDSFGGIDIALFSAGGSISKKFGPMAAAQGTIVVDNSSAFRMDDGIPLVIPEVNPEAMTHIKLSSKKGALIANPNCSTIICLMAVTPLHRFAKVKRMVVSTYQAASGAGAAAMAELEQQTREVLEGKEPTCNIFSQQYAFNLFSHNSSVLSNGYNEEEMKLVKETRKIWGDQDVRVTATCVRVPVMRAHAESVNLQFEKPLDEDTARDILKKADGIIVIDDRAANYFPTPLEVSNKDDVAVGRIRHDVSQDGDYGLDLFVCGDQIRKGAALNAVQIAERLL